MTVKASNKMPCTGFNSESYDLYALGILEGEEDAGISAHLHAACETCRRKLQQSLERTAAMAASVPSVGPSGRLRSRIVGSVRPADSGIGAWLRTPSLGWAAAAFTALAGISGVAYLTSETQSAAPPLVISRLIPPESFPAPAPSPGPEVNPEASSEKSSGQVSGTALADANRALQMAQAESAALRQDADEQRNLAKQLEVELQTGSAELAAVRQERGALQTQLASVASADGGRVQQLQKQLAADERQLDSLNRQVHFYQTAIDLQKTHLDRDTQMISLLGAPNLRVLDLQATEQGGRAFGRALLTNGAPVVFYASKLPVLPAGHTYQLWLMRDRGRAVTSGGIFQPDANQSAMLSVSGSEGAAGVTALAVTEEPAGGRPLPTGHKILIGAART